MYTQHSIRVVIIEDDDTIREGYRYLIQGKEGYEVVNAYPSFEDAAKNLEDDQPDVILLDIELPGIKGIEAIPRIKNMLPQVHVLILTVYESEKTLFDALSNGASGYITKNAPADKIVDSVREVVQGGGPMSMNIARMVVRSFQKNTQSPLSKRETQILEEIASGKSRSRIADELFIDLETVKTHIKNIYQKLCVHSRADAIRTAKDNKLI